MPIIKWEENYSVNIREIDEQHKKLFSIIDEFYEASITERAPEKIEETFKRLIDYADYHLNTEEKYFKQFDYPDKEAHTAQHDDYRKKINEWHKNYKSDVHASSINLMDFLQNWWTNHVIHTDKKYSDFFNKHGLK